MKNQICSAVRALVLAVIAGACVAGAADPTAVKPKASHESFVYVGTYTGGESRGIYLFRMNQETGELTSEGLAGETMNPSFLALHPNGRYLYSVNEISGFGGKPTGVVSAFSVTPTTGMLNFLNPKASGGGGPCHLVVDAEGNHVLVANYGGGSVEVLPILESGQVGDPTSFVQHEGSSVNSERQTCPHAHGIYLDAANRFAFVPDLGLDKIFVYRFNAKTGSLSPNDPPYAAVKPGSGPRHFAFHPDGHRAYVINEMLCTITAFSYDPEKGVLKETQTLSTLPGRLRSGYSTAEIFVHPSGRFLYGSNRGHDSIVVCAIDSESGHLKVVEHKSTGGKTPRSFGIDPSGKFLLATNQDSDTIVVFTIDQESGKLEPTGQQLKASKPVSVEFLPIP